MTSESSECGPDRETVPFFIAGFIPTVLYLSFIGLPLVGLVLKAITSEGLIDALTGSFSYRRYVSDSSF